MLEVDLRDQCSEALAAMPERLRQTLAAKANVLAASLQEKIQQKLSGGVLHARSGALIGSIVTTIEASDTSVIVRIGSSGNVKYATIHEYGGTVPPHQIVPDKTKALAFALGGKQMFAARVNLPAVTMPERSYLRSSLAEMADEIKRSLADGVQKALA